nr:MAG TPA: hypothetical protein [Caudoviricetes sp.]
MSFSIVLMSRSIRVRRTFSFLSGCGTSAIFILIAPDAPFHAENAVMGKCCIIHFETLLSFLIRVDCHIDSPFKLADLSVNCFHHCRTQRRVERKSYLQVDKGFYKFKTRIIVQEFRPGLTCIFDTESFFRANTELRQDRECRIDVHDDVRVKVLILFSNSEQLFNRCQYTVHIVFSLLPDGYKFLHAESFDTGSSTDSVPIIIGIAHVNFQFVKACHNRYYSGILTRLFTNVQLQAISDNANHITSSIFANLRFLFFDDIG